MADPAIAAGKSKEEIAYLITSGLTNGSAWTAGNKDAILDLYAECLEATSGKRNKPTGPMAGLT